MALGVALAVASVLLMLQLKNDIVEPRGKGRSLPQMRSLRWRYVVGFTFMSLGDWLQGPFLLDMYRSFNLSDSDVALLYMVDYGVALLCCLVVGPIATLVGSKRACVLYGVLYGASCLCNNFNGWHQLVVLGCGLDGLCNALLRTSFESWLDGSVRRVKGLGEDAVEAWTGHISALGTWGSACSSIIAGLLCQGIVWAASESSVQTALADYLPSDWVSNPSFPFQSTMNAASLLLFLSALGVELTWREPNRNTTTNTVIQQVDAAIEGVYDGVRCFFPVRPTVEASVVRRIAAVEICVEGALLLFIGGLPSTLHFADPTTPYGVTFVVLMASILVGSVAANWAISSRGGSKLGLGAACYVASMAATFLGLVVFFDGPSGWARGGVLMAACVIEVCFGFYYPALAALHSQYTSVEHLRIMCVSLVRCLGYAFALIGLAAVWYTDSLVVYWVGIGGALFTAAALCY